MRDIQALHIKAIPTLHQEYFSVLDQINLAVSAQAADYLFRSAVSVVLHVKRALRFGYFDFDVVRTAKDVSEAGRFIWQMPGQSPYLMRPCPVQIGAAPVGKRKKPCDKSRRVLPFRPNRQSEYSTVFNLPRPFINL
jgi:CRISPR/Cas system CMR-associated protein Cmr3 (group 5 of RAMP superfamily)